MKVDNDVNKRQMHYTAAGIGTGAVAGGAFGYLQKPWIKNGELSDSFIKQVSAKNVENDLKHKDTIISELKKLSETGNIDNVSEYTITMLDDAKNKTAEQIKDQANVALDYMKSETGAKNIDELPQMATERIKENSFAENQKHIDELKSLKITEDISVDEIAKLYDEKVSSWTEKSVENIQQEITAKGKKFVVDELKQDIADEIKSYQENITEIKDSTKEYIDISGKKMKDLPSDANIFEKDFYNIIKKSISETNWKNAGKWAGIGAAALGVIGLGISSLTGKKNS